MNNLTITMNPTIDVSTSIENVAADRKLRCKPPRFDPGGGGINVSRAIKHLGGESLAIYPSGEPSGKMLQRLLENEDISQNPVPIQNSTRENITVLETSSDQQYRFVMPGPELSENEWQTCLQVVKDVQQPDFLVASGSLPPGVPRDFYARLASIAKKRNIKFVVDTKGEALTAALEEGVYFIKPNVRELGQLVGKDLQDEDEQTNAAQSLVENNKADFLVISLGAAGILLVTRDQQERINAPVVQVNSKVGAGDSMVAGMVYSLSQGNSVRDAAIFGIAAGTAAVKTPGSELCHKEDTVKLYKRIQEKSKHDTSNDSTFEREKNLFNSS